MFESSLAAVLRDPSGNQAPQVSEKARQRMTNLSPTGRNVLQPLAQRTGQNLLPEKLQSFFAQRLADHNALQRLGMQTDFDLEGKVAFVVQDAALSAEFRDPASPSQSFESNQLSTLVYNPLSISISTLFARNLVLHHEERLTRYLEEMILSEGGQVIEQKCLVGTGANGEPLGLIASAEASGSASHLVTFPSAGVDASSLQDMLEDLAAQKAGIEPDACGWIVGEAVYKRLQGLTDPSGTQPLIHVATINGKARKFLLNLPLEVSSNMPAGKVVLANFRQACRLLYWTPNMDVIINPFGGTGQVQVVAQQYCNLAILRPELVVLGA